VVGGYFNPVEHIFFPAPFYQELLATEKDLNYVGPTEEALNRVKAKTGLPTVPYLIQPDVVKGMSESITVGMNVAFWGVDKSFSEEAAYQITKELIANVDKFANYHALGKIMTKEMFCWKLESADLHPGAYRAYQEAGLME
jgi:hypothetical protein